MFLVWRKRTTARIFAACGNFDRWTRLNALCRQEQTLGDQLCDGLQGSKPRIREFSTLSCISCVKLTVVTFRIALVYTTLCRDSVEYRVAIVLSELCVRSVSAPSTQIRGCSLVWIIHFQCACHQTRSTYCQPTITQTTLSTLPPVWHSVSSNCLISPPA